MHPSWFQSLKYYTGIISLGVLLGFGLQFAQAWSNPTQSAPNGNVAGPVNTGLLTQIKQGSLGLLGNLSAGLVQLTTVVTEGSPCVSTGLVGRDTNGVVLSCQGGVWRKGSGGGAVKWCAVNDRCEKTPNISHLGVCLMPSPGTSLGSGHPVAPLF